MEKLTNSKNFSQKEKTFKVGLELVEELLQRKALIKNGELKLLNEEELETSLDEFTQTKLNELLAKLLFDRDCNTGRRETAAEMLSKFGGQAGLTILMDFLSLPTEVADWLQHVTARLLWETGDKNVFSFLIDYILDDDNDRWVRSKIIKEGKLANIDYTKLINFENLSSALLSGDTITSHWAASVLGTLGDKRAVGPLISVLESEYVSWYEREGVVIALGQLKDTRAVEPLICYLQTGENNWMTIHALANIGDSRASKPLIELLESRDTDIRVAAIEALTAIGDMQALPKLAWLAENDDGIDSYEDSVKDTAIKAMAAIKQRYELS